MTEHTVPPFEVGDPCPSGRPYPHAYDARCGGTPLAPGGVIRPSGEPTSAALRRVTGERDELRETLAVYRQELAAALPALKRTATERDEARAAVSNALRCFDELQTAAGRKYQELGDERDEARAEVDRLGLSLLKSGQANDALLAGSERLAQQCQLAEAELSSARRELAAAGRWRELADRACASSDQALAETRDRCRQISADADLARAELSAARQELELLRRQAAEARTDADVARDELASAVGVERARIRDLLARHLLAAIRCIPDGRIQTGCVVSDGATVRERLRQAYRDAFPSTNPTEQGRP